MIGTSSTQLLCDDLPTQRKLNLETVLVAGATGYIGGRLVPELIARGYRVRIMVRRESEEMQLLWPEVEVVIADALCEDQLERAMEGVHTAYYLIHSMLIGPHSFAEADRCAAHHFRLSAARQQVQRIIYLGGLGDRQSSLSSHLSSRMEVGQELAAGSVPVTFLRASIIIGSGSASYEMLNHLVRRLPIMPIPRWAKTRTQPIGLRDVIKYLVGALELPATVGKTYDIGGPDVMSYEQLLRTHAQVLGRKRLFFSSPFSNISFFAGITSLLTPVPSAITRCLMESVEHEMICEDQELAYLLPFRRISSREALVLALSREEQDAVHTRWTDNYPPHHELAIKLSELEVPPTYGCRYSLESSVSADALFQSISHIGGDQGWFYSTPLWRIRGFIDRLVRGVGLRRGRRSPTQLRINDVVDFWRVEKIRAPRWLLLRAEMKSPGLAWLAFEVEEQEQGRELSVQAHFQADGFWGHLYWYIFLPFHYFIFQDLIRQIDRRAREIENG